MTEYSIIFAPADVSHSMNDMQQLYIKNIFVKKRYDQVSNYAGISVDILLRKKNYSGELSHTQIISLSLLAGMVGIYDYLISLNVPPKTVSGISLGQLVAFCCASAISLKDAVGIIKYNFSSGRSKSTSEAVGFVFVPGGDDDYYRNFEGIDVAVDYGFIQNNSGKFLMLSGLRSNLEEAQKEGPWDLDILDQEMCDIAYHSKLRIDIGNKLYSLLSNMEILPCSIPVLSCIPNFPRISKPEDVAIVLSKGEYETLHVTTLLEQLKLEKIDKVICIGPFLRSLNFPFTVESEYYDETTIYE
ncbi:MAG: hypothetical protein J6583_05520 [Gilliamella sp.]|nr:hypothetical protein [Gilliamella sp.]